MKVSEIFEMLKPDIDERISFAISRIQLQSLSSFSTGGVDATTVQVMINSSIAAHESAADPHAVYLTASEGNALYALNTISVVGSGSLGGGGDLTTNRAISLNTPGTLSSSSTNASSTNHTHSIDSTIARSAITITGSGSLGGGGDLTANRTITLNTPGTLSESSSNSSSTNHTHSINSTIARSAITFSVSGLGLSGGGNLTANRTITLTSSSNPGAAQSILASDSSGKLTLPLFVATTSVTTPVVTSSTSLSLGSTNNIVSLASSSRLQSQNYSSQTTGWAITYAGGGDFRYLFADEMHVKTFIADLEQALAGGQIIAKSVAILYSDFLAPIAGGGTTLVVRDLPSASGMAVFQNGDIVGIRNLSRSGGSLIVSDCYGDVTLDTSYGVGGFDSATKTQRYTFFRSSGTIGAGNPPGSMPVSTTVVADSIIIDYGVSGNGYYEVNAIDGVYGTNSPYAQTVVWTGHPANGKSVRARFGNLKGIFGAGNEYGLFAGSGSTSSDTYLRISNVGVTQNNVTSSWTTGGTSFITIDTTKGINIEATGTGYATLRAYTFSYGASQRGGLSAYANGGETQMILESVGPGVTSRLQISATNTLTNANAEVSISAYNAQLNKTATISLFGISTTQIALSSQEIYGIASNFYIGDLSSDGIKITQAWSNYPSTGANNGSEISNDIGSYKTLMIAGNKSNDGSTRRVNIYDNLFVSQRIKVGDVSFISDNLGTFLAQATSVASSISLANTSRGNAAHIGFNAYMASVSGAYDASGAWKFYGSQYTGNVTAAGLLSFDGNGNRFHLKMSETGLSSGSDITTWSPILDIYREGIISVLGASAGGAVGAALALKNVITAPTSNPTGGGVIFVQSGALKYRGSSGTVTTLAVA